MTRITDDLNKRQWELAFMGFQKEKATRQCSKCGEMSDCSDTTWGFLCESCLKKWIGFLSDILTRNPSIRVVPATKKQWERFITSGEEKVMFS